MRCAVKNTTEKLRPIHNNAMQHYLQRTQKQKHKKKKKNRIALHRHVRSCNRVHYVCSMHVMHVCL